MTVVNVTLVRGEQPCAVGRLLHKDRTIFFEYDPAFLQTSLQLSPFHLPLKPGVIRAENTPFEGLFGVFHDSLPDGWGRLLLDRHCAQLGLNPQALTPLERLCFVGRQGMGALQYEPEQTNPFVQTLIKELDTLAAEIQDIQQHDSDRFVEDLLQRTGSSAGARPKVILQHDNREWLVKFASGQDSADSGAIEYAYHQMAQLAGLTVAKAQLFPARQGGGYFGSQRFDRADNQRIHMHTLAGLLHADHRLLTLDYETLIKATALLTRHQHEVEKQFRAAVFNILSHNRDDHAKNFSFLLRADGNWRVSPAYDLTFSNGPGGEHCMTVMGEGKNPSRQHLLKLAAVGQLSAPHANTLIDEVASALAQWPVLAQNAGVSRSNRHQIQRALQTLIGRL